MITMIININLLVAFPSICCCLDMQSVFGIWFQTGQFSSSLEGVSDRRLPLDLWTDLGAFNFLVKDFVTSEVTVGLFRLLPDQVEGG